MAYRSWQLVGHDEVRTTWRTAASPGSPSATRASTPGTADTPGDRARRPAGTGGAGGDGDGPRDAAIAAGGAMTAPGADCRWSCRCSAAALTLLLGRRPPAAARGQRRACSSRVAGSSRPRCSRSTWRGRAARVAVGGWAAPLGIVLVADRLAALMLVVSADGHPRACWCTRSGRAWPTARRRRPLSVYHPTYLVLTAGVANAFLAGDLFNLYVGFEILLVASYVLLTLGGTETRVLLGTTYVVVSLLSSLIFLTGARPGLRGHRHPQPGPARRAARRAARARAAGAAGLCCCSPSGSRPRCSRCRRGCPTATRPPPPR